MRTAKKGCPKGMKLRKSYTRRFTTPVKEQGFTRKLKSGRKVLVHPKRNRMYVAAACIKNTRAAKSGARIGPLKSGDLKKFGYVYRLPTDARHSALARAIGVYGALSTYRKLDAVTKLAVSKAPDASRVFAADRDWIRKTFGPLREASF
jgi:hypothetical protein